MPHKILNRLGFIQTDRSILCDPHKPELRRVLSHLLGVNDL
jgi:hypothetical protein